MQETQQRAESVQEFVKPHALQLSQTTVQQLEIRRNILIPPRTPASSNDGETAGSIGAPDKVECQCGWDGEEDDMVGCDTDMFGRLVLIVIGPLRLLRHVATPSLLRISRNSRFKDSKYSCLLRMLVARQRGCSSAPTARASTT
jgi:hypothetical protein